MPVPPEVRGALIARAIDSDDVLARLSVPVLVTHGREDAIILPSMAGHTLQHRETTVPPWHKGISHMPFLQDTERFNHELAAFVDQVRT
jgi:pimeloyl-ACP methyl ester carboxylesterase